MVAGLLLLVFCARLDAVERQRKGWYVGFGLGSGFDAAIGDAEETYDFKDFLTGLEDITPKISLNFKVGKTLSPNLLMGFDITAVGQLGTDVMGTQLLQISNYFAMLTWFPFQKGLFIRGGGGLSMLGNYISASGFDLTETYYGGGLLAGIGYAFWLGRHFNLTLNLDHSRQIFVGDGPDRGRFTIVYVGFDWY
jgi:hypothetical protein